MAYPTNYCVDTLHDHLGHDFGCSTSTLLDQSRINHFAECTGDDQWIHVDVERARLQTPFASTIAHGLLLLSLVPTAQFELGVYPHDATNVLNYGFDKVRFLAPVPAGSRVVVQVELAEVEAKGPGRTLVRCRNTAFIEGAQERPVMVAESMGMVLMDA
ncbi:MaoC family dehydratase [Variovorax sp. J22R24]|uniref:MaoC family dehydratase n=1 Tax=Variovorax TaxID=34072 RepID=UPI0025788FC2|nr:MULTISPECIES: MaoC family dehydratase [unclassified Variovorax]MDM0053848.1 MaoC family dehydratase [Variovorax sp. J22R115]MDM0106548.1 MaoC family dehydratase [Variovorax sp. J22R24]